MSRFTEFLHKLGTSLGPIWEVVEPSVNALSTTAGQTVLSLATKFVAEAATNPALTASGGKGRAEWVQSQIKASTANTGNPVADSLINLAVEVALQKYKDSTSSSK